MTTDRDFERRLASWLESTAPLPAPDLADRLLRATAATPQRRRWMARSGMVRLVAAAAVLAVAAVIGLQVGRLLPGPVPPVGGEPSATQVAPPSSSSPPGSSVPSTAPASATPSPSSELFPAGNNCENDTDGYAVDYPSDWYANDEILPSEGFDGVSACRYFAPNEFDILPNAGVPPTVAISFQRVPDETPVDGTLVSSEQTTVGGRDATVRESETGEGGFGMPPGTRIYEYLIALDGGEVLIVATDSSRDGDYTEHQRVMDLMMDTVEFRP